MDISSLIKDAVSYINSYEERKRKIAAALAPLKKQKLEIANANSTELLEGNFVFPVAPAELNFRCAGVDSGFMGKRLSSADIVLVRAAGVVFDYEKGKLAKAQYHPNFFSFPTPHLSNNALEDDEYACSMGLIRLREEVNVAREILQKYKPRYLFLDGSIVPQYADKPRSDSVVRNLYHEILQNFQSLYSEAEAKGCTLIACVEDSRGKRINELLRNEINRDETYISNKTLNGMFDWAILDYLLEVGERTMAFSYSGSIKKHPILADMPGWREHIYGLYLRPAQYDRPLRIEFLCRGKGDEIAARANEAAGAALALSSMHREYAYPAVLIEADLKAHLKQDEIEIVFGKIFDKLGKDTRLKLRRESRPF
ncbi:DNA double-strand break repair nuclease NurA [Candidatus Micrarchaeota archaeon]|nr:DNA double-strand break repair nuclease NurA [Candidatus Micrarchaeota archaeon]MBU1939448.1 DNA double-strand break repair nuclease NurA [Candidatus Micrarchaeota archaeon]